jgi:hypothetical protein
MLIQRDCGRAPQRWWLRALSPKTRVIPAKAGIHWRRSVGSFRGRHGEWIPAFAGKTMVFLGEFAQHTIRSL